jgi:hypothetical protein
MYKTRIYLSRVNKSEEKNLLNISAFVVCSVSLTTVEEVGVSVGTMPTKKYTKIRLIRHVISNNCKTNINDGDMYRTVTR